MGFPSRFLKADKKNGRKWVSPRRGSLGFSVLPPPTHVDGQGHVRANRQGLSAEGDAGRPCVRWHDREGTDFAAGHPASVAFDLVSHECRRRSGAVEGQVRQDPDLAQRNFSTCRLSQGKGRWMTSAELAEIGLDEMVEGFSGGEKGKE